MPQDSKEASTVLFDMRTQFIVCHVESHSSGKWIIYLRELQASYVSYPRLWVDEECFNFMNTTYQQKLAKEFFEKGISLIVKPSSDLAKSYLNSQMFRATLRLCKNFKVVSSNTRKNEGLAEPYYAGAKFFQWFMENTYAQQPAELQAKFDQLVFCRDEMKALENL